MTMATAGGDDPQRLFATPAIVAVSRGDGSILVRSTTPLRPSARCVGDWLEHWARQAPERIFLGERASAEVPWSTVSYRDALGIVRRAASWILLQGLSSERPLVISPITASTTRCSRSPPSMSACPRPRSRRPIR